MQKIKEKIAEHKMKKEMRQDEYDVREEAGSAHRAACQPSSPSTAPLTRTSSPFPVQNTAGATTYGETGAMGGHHHHHGAQGMATGGTYAEGEVVGDRPVAVGVAEVSAGCPGWAAAATCVHACVWRQLPSLSPWHLGALTRTDPCLCTCLLSLPLHPYTHPPRSLSW
jgi:hypothetical protein